MNRDDETTFSKQDTINGLSPEQIELLARTQSDLFIHCLRERTIWDVDRIRLLLELGVREANRMMVGGK